MNQIKFITCVCLLIVFLSGCIDYSTQISNRSINTAKLSETVVATSKVYTKDEITAQNVQNLNASADVCKVGDWIYYIEARSHKGPSSIVRVKTDGTEKTVVYTDKRYIGKISLTNENKLCVTSIYSEPNSEVSVEYFYLLNLSDNKVSEYKVDTAKITGIPNSSLVDVKWYRDYISMVINVPTEKADYEYSARLYVQNKNRDIKLIAENLSQYYIIDDSIFYNQANGKIIYKINLDATDKISILASNNVDGFSVYKNYLFYETVGHMYIKNLSNNKILNIKGDPTSTEYYNSFIMNYDDEYFYCFESGVGLVKMAYDGKNKIVLAKDMVIRSITLIDDCIYFTNEYTDPKSGGLYTNYNLYKVKKDGTNLIKVF